MAVERLEVAVHEFPLDEPESDGTLTWDATTMVIVEASADGTTGVGYSYGAAACATVVQEKLRDVAVGSDPMDVGGTWERMVRAIRNLGRPGVVSHAISAVDLALWDLKARLLDVSLAELLGAVREEVPVYGSGGFTSLSNDDMERQLLGWVRDRGIPRVKIKVGEDWGRRPGRDLERVELARRAIGDEAELYVDANGGYTRKQAVRLGRAFADHGVTWFEEPVSSDDLEGLREIRDQVEPDVAAGEYGYDLAYFQRMLRAGAVDCLQADVTRCGGITEFLRVGALAAAHGVQLSAHCAPAASAAPCAAVHMFRHLEHFADHERIESLAFDGVLDPKDGVLRPDRSRPGTGLELKRTDIERFRRS
ncbi:MAG TPA: enolase C-terminal domain-like protein [Actinomycetota bacterium]